MSCVLCPTVPPGEEFIHKVAVICRGVVYKPFTSWAASSATDVTQASLGRLWVWLRVTSVDVGMRGLMDVGIEERL